MTDDEVSQISARWRGSLGKPIRWESLHEKHTAFLVIMETGTRVVLKNVGDTCVLERLASEYDVLVHLDRFGVPVSVPCLAEAGTPYVMEAGQVYTLSPALPSEDWSEVSDLQALCADAGRQIGLLHRALLCYSQPIQSWRYDLPPRVFEEAVPHILGHLTRFEREELTATVKTMRLEMTAALSGLPEQRIHGDSHSGNILVYHGRVSGFIDMDHLPCGPRIYDLGYLMADLLKNCPHRPGAWAEYLDAFGVLLDGYETEYILSSCEREALWFAMLAVQLMFTEVLFAANNVVMARANMTAFYQIYRQKEQIQKSLVEKQSALIA